MLKDKIKKLFRKRKKNKFIGKKIKNKL